MNDKHLAKLRHLCHQWGGSLFLVSEVEFTDTFGAFGKHDDDSEFDEAPFQDWHGINWHRKFVIAADGKATANGLIHEMGHVFACALHPDRANLEFEWFGWEIALARQVGLYKEWSDGNTAYGIDWWDSRGKYARDWGHLNQTQQRELSAERVAVGIKNKIISKDGRPLAIR